MKLNEHVYSHEGLELLCLYEYEAGQVMTDVDPSFPPIVTILEVYINDGKHEIYSLIDPKIIMMIEAEIVERGE